MSLALGKSHSNFKTFSFVHLTMERSAMKFDPTQLIRPPRKYCEFFYGPMMAVLMAFNCKTVEQYLKLYEDR